MRLLLPRQRLRLLMPLERPSLSSSSAPSAHLKRSFAQQAHAYDESAGPSLAGNSPSSRARGGFGLSSDSSAQPPAKAARLEESMPHQPHKGSLAHQSRHPTSGFRSLGSSKSQGSKLGKRHKVTIPPPIYTEAYIKENYQSGSLKPGWIDNAKSVLMNWLMMRTMEAKFDTSKGYDSDGRLLNRCKLTLEYEGETYTAYGDDVKATTAERLASLWMLYILSSKELLTAPKKPDVTLSSKEETLSDGSVVDYERARQFMDYYCRRFSFGKPEFSYVERRNKWEAVMTVNDRRIGMATATNKKGAIQACYVDVTKYLESCDPELWKTFVEDAKTGKDLGLAPPVFLRVDDRLEDQIENLCADVKRSTLYKNKPRPCEQAKPTAALYVPPSRRKATEAFMADQAQGLRLNTLRLNKLADKSQKLLNARKRYLEDPLLEKIRTTRQTLPVYTKAEPLLEHIRNHEVTICMAATGSGKTTQIPQLILDEWIDKGEGAKCNIMCTQPRRLAAISVANRVAAERGERTGETVGYQVRFEAKLPQPNGSITFCTIGTFLRRLQAELQGPDEHRDLDDVTHILVDEVHERDVETDLLLVVLKRLMADRKAREKPLKIVLMSATIDPKPFQEYFHDVEGELVGVTEVPGRSYPVQKHFLDEFVTEVVSASKPVAKRVLAEDKVKNYLSAELQPPALLALYEDAGVARPSSQVKRKEEDMEVPWSLVALTITHVIKNSEEGHVLVFLPGWEEISGVQKTLLESSMGVNYGSRDYAIHCLHSSIPVAEQQVIFEPPPAGQRRIILSTNIAETSVTIPNVVYVVDTGRIKENRYNPDKRISAIVTAPVGKSNLNQRAGRAGRHRPGEYYGLLSRARADALHTHQTVEMKRVDLSNIVMRIKALKFPGVTVEEVLASTIEPPPVERVEAAIDSLQMVGALDDNKQLTSLGRVLLQLPLDVQMGRLVLYGCFFRCLGPALTLASLLAGRDIFLTPMHLKNEAFTRKNSFCPETFRSDALAMLAAYNEWWERQSRGHFANANAFCMDNFLAKPTMLQIEPVRRQIMQLLFDIGVIEVCAGGALSGMIPPSGRQPDVPAILNTNAKSLPVLAALIAIASQPNFAVRTGDRSLRTSRDKIVFIPPSSVNNRKKLDLDPEDREEKELIAFSEKRQNMSIQGIGANIYLMTTTRMDPITYILFGAYNIKVYRRGLECDGWLPIYGNMNALDDLQRLKSYMDQSMLRVFEGIIHAQAAKRRRPSRPVTRYRDEQEDESGDEDDGEAPSALSTTEIRELDLMTRDLTRILIDYDNYRLAMQSRHNSLPGTPLGSPSWRPGRLPPMGGTRSGYSTPHHAAGGMFHSRPGTPSRLR